jgi:zinc protease
VKRIFLVPCLLPCLVPCLLLVGGPAVAAAPEPLAHESMVLGNGMRVFLIPDHRHPTVAIAAWYRVGSGDEARGRSGLAHLFEHLMFKGSPHVPDGVIDKMFEEAGGLTNAYTDDDATVYEDLSSASFLPRALWLEADRIAGLADALDKAKLDNQRDVVLNERRQSYENRPYGMAELLIEEALWPEGHPYHISTIGKPEDLRAATVDDAKAFFRRWYAPSNLTMVIIGDIDPAPTKALVEKYLGWIPSPPAPARPRPPAPPAPIAQEIDLHAVDDVQVPRVYLTWRTPPTRHKDEPALDLLGIILAGDKSSRLYQSLVVEGRLAQDVHAGNASKDVAGELQIVATAKPGVDAEKLIQKIDAELLSLQQNGPHADEVIRAKNRWETRLFEGLESPLGRAELLASYDVHGDPDFLDKDLARYRAVTAADIQASAQRYLKANARVVLIISPGVKHGN